MAQQLNRSKPRGATGPMHPKPPKLQKPAGIISQLLPAETDSDFIHAVKCAVLTALVMLSVFGLLIWSAA